MKKISILLAFLLSISFSSIAFSKEYKLYVCDFFVAFNLAKDECEGSNSWYKIYFDNEKYSSKDSCLSGSNEWVNGPIMTRMFPEGDPSQPGSWIYGCDTLWKYYR